MRSFLKVRLVSTCKRGLGNLTKKVANSSLQSGSIILFLAIISGSFFEFDKASLLKDTVSSSIPISRSLSIIV